MLRMLRVEVCICSCESILSKGKMNPTHRTSGTDKLDRLFARCDDHGGSYILQRIRRNLLSQLFGQVNSTVGDNGRLGAARKSGVLKGSGFRRDRIWCRHRVSLSVYGLSPTRRKRSSKRGSERSGSNFTHSARTEFGDDAVMRHGGAGS
jgi:hypothetical protein